MKYVVTLIPEDEGGYSVIVPGLPGCCSQGATREEALDNIKEAIELYNEVAHEIAEEQGEAAEVQVDVRVA
ncbi:MAG TPA: type II toxin-antitoxin system HicB family antitoxin [Fimbriimonadaceae bacterium]|jgi:predicted RNase H-like HicB family nuclease